MRLIYMYITGILLLFSCGDKEQEMSVNFQLKYDEEPLVMFDEYEFGEEGGFPVELTRVSFFISDLKMNIDGQEELIREADYLDLTESHSTLEKSEAGYNYSIGTTMGNPTSISFNFGLTPEQNLTVPTDYLSSNILSRTAEYWSGWSSYVMYKIEGNIDLDRDGIKEKGIALHMGTTNVTRATSGTYSDDLTIVIDLQTVFNCGEVFDIVTTPMIHNLSQIDKAEKLADNLICGLKYRNN